MIVQIIGWFSLVIASIEFIGSIALYNINEKDGARWAGVDSSLLLICAAICFK